MLLDGTLFPDTERQSIKIYRAIKSSIIIPGRRLHQDPKSNHFDIIGQAKLKLPAIPSQHFKYSRLIYTNQNELLLAGPEECSILSGPKWKFHSKFNEFMLATIIINMPNGVYIFGISKPPPEKDVSYFLPNQSNIWQNGPNLPEKGRVSSCGLAISQSEFLLIGGVIDSGDVFQAIPCSKIWKYNINIEEWQMIGNIQDPRFLASAAIFNDRLIINGGGFGPAFLEGKFELKIVETTEIISLEKLKNLAAGVEVITKKVKVPRLKREVMPNLGIVRNQGVPKLIAFGGAKEIEEWNDEDEKWDISKDLSMPEARSSFGYCYSPT